MDGLSATASGMAVISLAFQLGESIKQLHDFWDSVKEAPDDIQTIKEDLGLLSSVLAEMSNEVQHSGPDQTLTRALKACCDKVNKLTRITNEMEPGFASRSLRMRKWTAFKAVFKSEKIHKFQKVLEGLKSTLILAQQSSHRWVLKILFDCNVALSHFKPPESNSVSDSPTRFNNNHRTTFQPEMGTNVGNCYYSRQQLDYRL